MIYKYLKTGMRVKFKYRNDYLNNVLIEGRVFISSYNESVYVYHKSPHWNNLPVERPTEGKKINYLFKDFPYSFRIGGTQSTATPRHITDFKFYPKHISDGVEYGEVLHNQNGEKFMVLAVINDIAYLSNNDKFDSLGEHYTLKELCSLFDIQEEDYTEVKQWMCDDSIEATPVEVVSGNISSDVLEESPSDICIDRSMDEQLQEAGAEAASEYRRMVTANARERLRATIDNNGVSAPGIDASFFYLPNEISIP